MSRLGDFENAIVARLATAVIGGLPAFQRVEGISGGWRPAIRDALARERTPTAYVGFVDEPTAPEVRTHVRGAKFVVLIAARTARVESNPRHGDATSVGALPLVDAARTRLDDWGIATGLRLVNVHVRFVDADDRFVVYEILYRVWPIVSTPPAALIEFDGSAIFGEASRLELEAGPERSEVTDFNYHGRDMVYSMKLAANARTIVLRGELRAANHAALNDIETAIEDAVKSETAGRLEEMGVREFSDCVIAALFRRGGRREEDGMIVQGVDVLFTQTTS